MYAQRQPPEGVVVVAPQMQATLASLHLSPFPQTKNPTTTTTTTTTTTSSSS
jgi:hypothetical protein